jgi:hypothetical protein
MMATAVCVAGGVIAVLAGSSGSDPSSASPAPISATGAREAGGVVAAPPSIAPAPAGGDGRAGGKTTPSPARNLVDAMARANPFVAIGGLRVQAHQVTRREYALYIAALPLPLARKAQAMPLRGWDATDPEAPVSWTRFEQAAAFCAACGARLPSHAEWMRASGGGWGLDPTGSGRPGPLREWTAERQDGWVRVAGATANMAPAQRAAARDEVLLFATEASRTSGALEDVDLASKEVGIRCLISE